MIYGKPKSEISSRIDRILNSTVDELDKIEICAAPSVTKNLSRKTSPSQSPTPTQNAHTYHVTSDDLEQTISDQLVDENQSESVNNPSDGPIAKPRKPLSPPLSPPTQIDFNKIEINQADIFDQLESATASESSNEQPAFACQTYNEKYSESDTLIITDQSELSIQSVESEPDQSETLNESVAEVNAGSETEVQQDLPKLHFEQVPAPGSEADLQAVQAVEPLPEPEVEALPEPEVEALPEPEVEALPEPEVDSEPAPEVEPEPEPEIEQVVSKPEHPPRAAPKVSTEAQKPSIVPAPKNVSATPQKEKSQLDVEQEEPQMREPSPIPIPEGGLNGVKAKYEQSIDGSKTSTPPPKSPLPEVGSIQDRLQKYSSFPTPASKASEPENLENQPIKIGKLSDRKSSYLKQFEQREDSSPSKLKTKTTSSGLKERMKAFESTNRSNLVRRETVTAGERAADIRSRISGWGNFAESNGYQKEQPKVGKINSRLDQYTKSATKKQPAVDQSEAEI